jgi:hypothetical protein
LAEAATEETEGEAVARKLEKENKQLSPQYNEAAKKYWAAREKKEKLQDEF